MRSYSMSKLTQPHTALDLCPHKSTRMQDFAEVGPQRLWLTHCFKFSPVCRYGHNLGQPLVVMGSDRSCMSLTGQGTSQRCSFRQYAYDL